MAGILIHARFGSIVGARTLAISTMPGLAMYFSMVGGWFLETRFYVRFAFSTVAGVEYESLGFV